MRVLKAVALGTLHILVCWLWFFALLLSQGTMFIYGVLDAWMDRLEDSQELTIPATEEVKADLHDVKVPVPDFVQDKEPSPVVPLGT